MSRKQNTPRLSDNPFVNLLIRIFLFGIVILMGNIHYCSKQKEWVENKERLGIPTNYIEQVEHPIEVYI